MKKRAMVVGIGVLLGCLLVPAGSAPAAERGGKAGPGKAQAGPTHAAPAGRGMAEELGLTPAQKQKAQAIFKSFAPKGKAIQEDRSLTEEQKRQKGKALFLEMQKQLAAVLTPQQREKLKTIQQRQKAEAGRRQVDFVKELGLTPAQQKKLEGIEKSFRARAIALQKNTSLTPQQKDEKMKALGEEVRKQREAVLTPAQLQKAKAMMGQHGGGMRKPGTSGHGAPAPHGR